MAGPYIHTTEWPAYIFQGQAYDLGHLNEFEFEMEDTSRTKRLIVVTFSDHVFTRDAAEGDDPQHAFPNSTREPPGHFCLRRYRHSLTIRDIILWCAKGEVWMMTGDDRYGQIPTVDEEGNLSFYAIVFSLEKVKGMPFSLHMRVRTAFPSDREPPDTFGSVKFKHLVELRVKNKRPQKGYDRKRRKPTLGTPFLKKENAIQLLPINAAAADAAKIA